MTEPGDGRPYPPPKRIGILGAGAVGSVVGGLLSNAGHDVTLIDPWFEHISAVQQRGLLVELALGEKVMTRPTAIHLQDLQAVNKPFDLGFIAVNAYDTDWATACLNRHVKQGGTLCGFQNAVNDDRIAAVAGSDRTMGVIVTISAAVYEPGIALRTDLNTHCFKVGELSGQDTPRARELAAMLGVIGKASVTKNLLGQRWSKLIVNCMNNAQAGLTGWMTAVTRTHPDTQRIGIQLAAEVVLVARACGMQVEEVMGLNPDCVVGAAAGDPQQLEECKTQLRDMADKAGDKSRPSFGQDVMKGRRTEIEALNGFVAAKGREKGIPTPFCEEITRIVSSLGVGFSPSPDHIRSLVTMLPEVKAPELASPGAEDLVVAGVGAGYFAQFHYEAWSRIDGVRVAAICDQDEDKAKQAAAKPELQTQRVLTFTDAETMLREVRPDVLDIITPPHTHLALVTLAVEQRIPTIICQKPLAPTLAEATQIVELAEGAGVLLIVHENFRWEPWHRELHRLLHNGVIGTCYSVCFKLRPGDGQGNPPSYVNRQPYFQQMKRFLIHETGIHFVDVFRFLLGEVCAVYADLQQLNPSIAGEDAGVVLFHFANGPQCRAALDCNRLVDHDATDTRLTMGEMWLEGSRGVLRLDGRGRIFTRLLGLGPEVEHAYNWSRRGFAGDSVFACQSHVAAHLLHKRRKSRDGSKPPPLANTGREFLRNVEIEEAIYESARAGQLQVLPALSVPKLVPEVVADVEVRAELGEGPIWDRRREGALLWVDILHARLIRYVPTTGLVEVHELAEHTRHVTTVVPVGDSGSLVILGTTEGVALYDLETRALAQHPANGSLHGEHTRMNDGKCDPAGRLWVGSVAKTGPGSAATLEGGAALYVYEGWEAAPTMVISGASIANGIVWNADHTRMYWIDSLTLGVDAFDFDNTASTHAGLATKRRQVVNTSTIRSRDPPQGLAPGVECVPDGMAIDLNGNLWVALHGAGEVRCFDPRSGALLALVELPVEAGVEVTACAWGGEQQDELYITTSAKFWSEERKLQMPLGGRLLRVPRAALSQLGPGARGVPENHFGQ